MNYIRNSAKAIIIKDNRVLLTKNIDDAGFFYLFPGGGQEFREELHETVVRECIEEVGCKIAVGELVFIREYISKNHEFAKWDTNLHQVEFYFGCSLLSEDETIRNGKIPDTNQVGVEWIPIINLCDIRLYPKELAAKIKRNISKPVYLGDVN